MWMMLRCSKSASLPRDTVSHRYREKTQQISFTGFKTIPTFVHSWPASIGLLPPPVELDVWLTPFLAHFENPSDNGSNDKSSKTWCSCVGFSCFLFYLLCFSAHMCGMFEGFWADRGEQNVWSIQKWKWCLWSWVVYLLQSALSCSNDAVGALSQFFDAS